MDRVASDRAALGVRSDPDTPSVERDHVALARTCPAHGDIGGIDLDPNAVAQVHRSRSVRTDEVAVDNRLEGGGRAAVADEDPGTLRSGGNHVAANERGPPDGKNGEPSECDWLAWDCELGRAGRVGSDQVAFDRDPG